VFLKAVTAPVIPGNDFIICFSGKWEIQPHGAVYGSQAGESLTGASPFVEYMNPSGFIHVIW
jgi:hypothetical protein